MLIKPATPKKVAGFSHPLTTKTKTPRRFRQRGFSNYDTEKQQTMHGSSPTLPQKPPLVKTLNPETGKPWRRGDIHPTTGKRFMSFHRNYANGEYWASEETYLKCKRHDTKDYFKEFNPDVQDVHKWNSANKWRRGTVHPETGLVFWGYRRRKTTTEMWLTPEEFGSRHPKVKEACAQYALANPEASKERRKRYYGCNKERLNEENKRWYRENRHHVNKKKKHRYDNDPTYQLTMRLRTRTRFAFLNSPFKKKSKTFAMIGCTQDKLFKHIEQQFTEGMSWDRLGEIEIDHIIPLSSAQTEEELIALCHYTNLQPLWATHNRSKGAKMPVDFQPPTE